MVTVNMVLWKYREAISRWEHALQSARNALHAAKEVQAPPDTVRLFEHKVEEAQTRVKELREARAAFMARYANGQEPQP